MVVAVGEQAGVTTGAESVRRARDRVLESHPGPDVVVTTSGVQLMEDLRDAGHFAAAEATVATNLLGTIARSRSDRTANGCELRGQLTAVSPATLTRDRS